jgi:hypothetical protein
MRQSTFIYTVTILIFLLQGLPALMIATGGDGRWGLLYVPFLIILVMWGGFITNNWFKIFR